MAYKIKQSKLFLGKTIKLLSYLEKRWGKKVAEEFKEVLDRKILQLAETPNIGINSIKMLDVKRVVITKHNKLFYNVKGKTIYLITLFDTRQHPNKNKYE